MEPPYVRSRIVTAPAAKARCLSVTRADVEDFLYLEAALLDDWKLTEWLALFVPGARYLVPPAGSNDDVDPATTLFYVADDYHRLTERVKRLGKKNAHVEFPHSRCRRMVSNVRIVEGSDESFIATSNFVTYRSKRGVTETYLGHHRYELCVDAGAIKIRKKTSFLDTDDINAQGKVSIIL
jgi:p-cumate 2,3-dioxygenase beta subunit